MCNVYIGQPWVPLSKQNNTTLRRKGWLVRSLLWRVFYSRVQQLFSTTLEMKFPQKQNKVVDMVFRVFCSCKFKLWCWLHVPSPWRFTPLNWTLWTFEVRNERQTLLYKTRLLSNYIFGRPRPALGFQTSLVYFISLTLYQTSVMLLLNHHVLYKFSYFVHFCVGALVTV